MKNKKPTRSNAAPKAKPATKPTFAAKGKSAEKSTFATKGKPTDKPTFGAKGKSAEKPAFESKGKSAEKSTFATKGKPTDKPTFGAKGKPTEKPAFASKGKFAARTKFGAKGKPAEKVQTTAKPQSARSKEGVQLNKYISSSGFSSRRQAELYIEEGRVTINDDIADLTDRVQAGDVVAVDGEIIKLKTGKQSLYLAFNKPQGITSTTDTSDKSNIIYYINHPKRIFPIGRLDKESEGLILLTNDGDIVNKILRAGNEHEKEYIVSVNKPLSPEFAQQMARGIPILGTKTKPCVVRQIGSKTFKIVLTEGLNRQIRRMCEFLNYEVVSLKRIRIMHITLGNLPVGKWRYLSHAEAEAMNNTLQKSVKTEEASARSKRKR